MSYTKIKRSADGEIVLVWEEHQDGVQTVKHELTSRDLPRPAFLAALQGFAPLIRELYQLEMDAALDVRGATFTAHDTMGQGIVVTALLTVQLGTAPAVLNTPHLTEADGAGEPVLPRRWRDAIRALELAADDYRAGKRAQGDLFEAEAADA